MDDREQYINFDAKLLQTDAFTYSLAGLAAIHRAIFESRDLRYITNDATIV